MLFTNKEIKSWKTTSAHLADVIKNLIHVNVSSLFPHTNKTTSLMLNVEILATPMMVATKGELHDWWLWMRDQKHWHFSQQIFWHEQERTSNGSVMFEPQWIIKKLFSMQPWDIPPHMYFKNILNVCLIWFLPEISVKKSLKYSYCPIKNFPFSIY